MSLLRQPFPQVSLLSEFPPLSGPLETPPPSQVPVPQSHSSWASGPSVIPQAHVAEVTSCLSIIIYISKPTHSATSLIALPHREVSHMDLMSNRYSGECPVHFSHRSLNIFLSGISIARKNKAYSLPSRSVQCSRKGSNTYHGKCCD